MRRAILLETRICCGVHSWCALVRHEVAHCATCYVYDSISTGPRQVDTCENEREDQQTVIAADGNPESRVHCRLRLGTTCCAILPFTMVTGKLSSRTTYDRRYFRGFTALNASKGRPAVRYLWSGERSGHDQEARVHDKVGAYTLMAIKFGVQVF